MKPRSLKVLTLPVIEPVTLTEARDQCGLQSDQTDWDRLLLTKIAAGRVLIEKRLSLTLVATQYRATWTSITCRKVKIPRPPLLVDDDHPLVVTANGVTISNDDLGIDTDSMPGVVELPSSASGELVMTFWGGAPATELVCPLLRSALLAYVEHQFRNRGVIADGSDKELPQGFETALAASSWNGSW